MTNCVALTAPTVLLSPLQQVNANVPQALPGDEGVPVSPRPLQREGQPEPPARQEGDNGAEPGAEEKEEKEEKEEQVRGPGRVMCCLASGV